MWCQNCGKERLHYHTMGSAKAKCCQRCRSRHTTAATYCIYCGVNRLEESSVCDVHYGNTLSTPASPTYDDSPPAYDSDSDEDVGYATDLSSPILSPSPSPPTASSSPSSSPVNSIYDRKQCGYCKVWFENESEYDEHNEENNSGCWKHKMCFPSTENYQHAKDSYHDRCFVPRCEDSDEEMSDEEVVEHVWRKHTKKGQSTK